MFGKLIEYKPKLLGLYTIVWIIVCLGVLWMAYHGYIIDSTKQIGSTDALYKSFKIFAFGDDSFPVSNSWVDLARFLGPLVMLGGGLPIVVSLCGRMWRRFCLMTYSNHTIIFGYDDIGMVLEEQRINKKEKVIIISPNIDERVSLNEMYFKIDEKSYLKDKELLLRAKVKKCARIFVVTDSDYRNLSIYKLLVKDLGLSCDKIRVRLEQLNLNILSNESGFRPSKWTIEEIYRRENHIATSQSELIVMFGLGQVGKSIVNKYRHTHDILILEQSHNLINWAKEEWSVNESEKNNVKVVYTEVCDINFLVKNDLQEILRKLQKKENKTFQSLTIFIALGGDWLSYKIALDCREWKSLILSDLKEPIKISQIILVANNLDPHLFQLNNSDLSSLVDVKVYNIHNVLKGKDLFST